MTPQSASLHDSQKIEELIRLNMELEHQLAHESRKNERNEKLMIAQSRMAMMGEMIGMIAHQWRQPITIIGMITNNTLIDMQISGLNKEQLLLDLDLIDKQIHYLSRTIDDFRNFFRPNKFPQKVMFKELSDELETILGKSFESLGIELIFKGDKNIWLTTYKNELLQVLLNILTNAKDAFENKNKKNKKIICSIHNHCESAIFFITDNAGGVPPDVFTHIFDPYFTTKDEQDGTGLGLYMSTIIVEKHLRGNIRASTDEIGMTFAITIPFQSLNEHYYVY